MPNNRKSLKAPRAIAFKKQHDKCFYCELSMWLSRLDIFLAENNLTVAQANFFKCTGEHLQAKCKGGKDSGTNIVAACWYCNTQRHRRKNPPNPEKHKKHVQKRINSGKWTARLLH